MTSGFREAALSTASTPSTAISTRKPANFEELLVDLAVVLGVVDEEDEGRAVAGGHPETLTCPPGAPGGSVHEAVLHSVHSAGKPSRQVIFLPSE